MSDTLNTSIVRQLLSQILSINLPQPELGARLKQRLQTAFAKRGLGVFDEKALGYRKFAEYLEKVHGDLVLIERHGEPGDILVSLKQSPNSSRSILLDTKASSTSRAIRSAVWQAFANPDPQRKRFFDNADGKVIHYVEGAHSEAQQKIEASPAQFVPIPPIIAATQNLWMREFLQNLSVGAIEKGLLDQMAGRPYSSTLNATFTRALGNHGQAWSRFRTERVTSIILSWAREKKIDSKLLYTPIAVAANADLGSAATAAMATAELNVPSAAPQTGSPREQVIKVLDLLSDEDLQRLVLPMLLSTVMIKSRL